MDHRTKNNFQIASSVLRLQATRSGNAEVSDALKRAANRILSIAARSEEHTSELQSLMRNSYAVFCLKKKKQIKTQTNINTYMIYQDRAKTINAQHLHEK